ncbi:VOC family protein [Pseudomonas sp. F1_0610]|uniref:2-oxoadipate dioxygenase/decarboxylase HglS n=1 Tax=Pseudomonas sp. F1_0610 TaxID=3114284 RepID=UPI0039C132EA
MNQQAFISPDLIRAKFAQAMSDMYQTEVPLYGSLVELVQDVNKHVLDTQPDVAQRLERTGEMERLNEERHGAIRLGKVEELTTMRRLFAVMGMQAVGYYDLTPAGVPVHSTAFRAVHEKSLQVSPFRVFTSLLRLDLIDNAQLRQMAEEVLAKRNIFTDKAIALIEQFEAQGGLNETDADEFVQQALETFRWHTEATVTAQQYQELHDTHRLIADIVAFKGPHINHLTPRTLDIDDVQLGMSARNIPPKAVIEGPPRRNCAILLRQTSFKALQEKVAYIGEQGTASGSHTARFGEIEQRGMALTPKGRALYDQLLNAARKELGAFPDESNAERYVELMQQHFQAFPDTYPAIRQQELGFFRYFASEKGLAETAQAAQLTSVEALIEAGYLEYEPLVYEDFLPVSAAGIFQSNLGEGAQTNYVEMSSQEKFEQALGAKVLNELALYAQTQQRSLEQALSALKVTL